MYSNDIFAFCYSHWAVKLLTLAVSWFFLSNTIAAQSDQLTNSGLINIDNFIFIKGGCFQMGDILKEGKVDEQPVHRVCLNNFYLGKYEVSKMQWKKVMSQNPSKFRGNVHFPIDNVSWEDAQKFITKLNRISKRKFRLPTEAEWEYACRNRGQHVRFGNGKNILKPNEVNFNSVLQFARNYTIIGQSINKPLPVQYFAPNHLGLHHMSGNIFEWVADSYDETYYRTSPLYNPLSRKKTPFHVLRGGSWYFGGLYARCTNRHKYFKKLGSSSTGFRLVAIYQSD